MGERRKAHRYLRQCERLNNSGYLLHKLQTSRLQAACSLVVSYLH